MTTGALLVGLALLVLTASFVLRPLKERRGLGVVEPEESRPPRLETVLTAIRDLDFDHRTGKVTEQDYRPARASLLARAAEAIAVPSGASMTDSLEARVREIRLQLKEGGPVKNCSGCGDRLLPGDRFCPHCGSPQADECPSCGSAVQHEDRFCAGCGRWLQPEVASIT